MATHVPFSLITKSDGTAVTTVNPSNNANGIAEWISTGSRSQAYRLTASVRYTSNQLQKYTVKVEIPKVETQTVNGVDLPVSAWRAFLNFDFSIPTYASDADRKLITNALQNAFKAGNPIAVAIEAASGFYS